MEDKDLERMTATKLRQEALKIPGLTGVHAMKKADLITAIRQARGLPSTAERPKEAVLSEIKQEIRKVKKEKEAALAARDKKLIHMCRARIKKLKRQTRRLAATRA